MGVMDKSDLLKELRIDRSAVEPAPRKWLWPLLAIVALLGIGALAWWFFAGPSALAVHTAVAQPMSAGGANASVLDATGYVTARRAATVSAQITGALTAVLIEEGEHVDAGQVLARLDETAQRASLAQAQAQAQVAQALLVQYQAQVAQSQRDLQRMQDMVGRKLVSQQAMEQARTLVETQNAQVETQRKQIQATQTAVQSAQVQLDYCTVHAPFAGVVIAKSAQVGEIISPFSAGGGFTRTGVGTIVDMDSLEIEVDVNEAYINRVVAGHPVDAVLNAYPDWKIPAHVIAIIPSADRGKATVKVRVAIDQKDKRILPDMGVRVSFMEESNKAAAPPPKGVLVPVSAIVQREGKSAVFVVDNERAVIRPVTAGQIYRDLRLVEGIAAGTRVIEQPPAELADGTKVKIKSTAN